MRVITHNKGSEPWRESQLGPCACSQLRQAARAVSGLYDEFLAASGVTVTQYALLVNVGRADGVSRTVLADRLGMERTTLTRNLRPLERGGLIREEAGTDRRVRVLRLTPRGLATLNWSYPHWEEAQKVFLAKFGDDRFGQLLGLLQAASAAAKAGPA
jgi:DNA-binding MarR family transcriptional regulator